MPSFDIVSEVDLQEARNAVDNASREVESRFDFRNVEASFELNDASKTIKVLSESDFQVNQLLDILRAKLLKRGIEGSSLDVPENIVHSGKTWFVEAKLKQGIGERDPEENRQDDQRQQTESAGAKFRVMRSA
ncbi:nucleotide-binding protein [Escherichia coli]|uniref:Nucleotide-binding protein n=1 Tax=Escherichia coli TaxID=562 RepID=A0A376K4Q6_ECOLX|nr:nucleotide-binding protein [Escherichia coli]